MNEMMLTFTHLQRYFFEHDKVAFWRAPSGAQDELTPQDVAEMVLANQPSVARNNAAALVYSARDSRSNGPSWCLKGVTCPTLVLRMQDGSVVGKEKLLVVLPLTEGHQDSPGFWVSLSEAEIVPEIRELFELLQAGAAVVRFKFTNSKKMGDKGGTVTGVDVASLHVV
jgi:hypothetical protein